MKQTRDQKVLRYKFSYILFYFVFIIMTAILGFRYIVNEKGNLWILILRYCIILVNVLHLYLNYLNWYLQNKTAFIIMYVGMLTLFIMDNTREYHPDFSSLEVLETIFYIIFMSCTLDVFSF